jgi:ribosomal protein S18 acetylase RimI-like enzyme
MSDEDGDAIARLGRAAFGEYDPHAERTARRLARSGRTFVACRGEELLGFAVVHVNGTHAELSAIAVDEHARGLGIGSRLLARAERAAYHAGARELGLHTADSNVSALEMFAKHGYRLVTRKPRYYRGVFAACALAKRLAFEPK